jgi:outer membrane lipoprotein-sorting protein
VKQDVKLRTLAILGLSAACASAFAGQDSTKPDGQAGDPGSKAATEVLRKTLAAYQTAKSYQGDWTYTMDQGGNIVKMIVELRAKGPTKLLFSLRPAIKPTDKEDKRPAGAIPELKVVLDGKQAWFENASEKVFYKVSLPKNAAGSPLMFFPQIATTNGAERGQDEKQGERKVGVIFAQTKTGGLSRMEIDLDSFHIVRIANEEMAGLIKTVSTLVIDKEVFDGEIAESAFSYKPGKGYREMPAPPDAGAVFGFGPPEKTDK